METFAQIVRFGEEEPKLIAIGAYVHVDTKPGETGWIGIVDSSITIRELVPGEGHSRLNMPKTAIRTTYRIQLITDEGDIIPETFISAYSTMVREV